MAKVHPVVHRIYRLLVRGHVLGAIQATKSARQESAARTVHAMFISDRLASHSVATRVILRGMQVASYLVAAVMT
jgi:hypothetical protein